MKVPALLSTCAVLALTSCQGWSVPTITYNPATTAPSRTPSIQTATALVLTPTLITGTAGTATGTATGLTPSPTLEQSTPSVTFTPSLVPASGSVTTDILGCDTSIDVLHGMGEVTNAYVKIANNTSAEVPGLCATLRALDEGRPHPDKTKCLASLPSGFQVTFKLTVDSTYKENSPVQVDVTSSGNLLERAGEPACTSIALVLATLDNLDVAVPI